MSAVSYVTVLCLTPDTCTGCYATTPSIAQRPNTRYRNMRSRTAVFRSLCWMARVVVHRGFVSGMFRCRYPLGRGSA